MYQRCRCRHRILHPQWRRVHAQRSVRCTARGPLRWKPGRSRERTSNVDSRSGALVGCHASFMSFTLHSFHVGQQAISGQTSTDAKALHRFVRGDFSGTVWSCESRNTTTKLDHPRAFRLPSKQRSTDMAEVLQFTLTVLSEWTIVSSRSPSVSISLPVDVMIL